MKVLVVGAGGREHALCWKLAQSDAVQGIYCAPGNPGVAGVGECVSISVDQVDELADFALTERIDLTIVGPEYPLTLGIVDAFEKKGLAIFGPNQAAARIEESKEFAKKVMEEAGVPTADYRAFSEREQAEQYLAQAGVPVVLKADGLAAGKGVFVCKSAAEVEDALSALFDQMKVDQVVIEEFLDGHEASYIVVTDGERVVPLAASHDYKRIFDSDQGPNTGGMGTVSPTPHLTAEQEEQVLSSIMYPVIKAMRDMGSPYRGFLFAGLMIDADGGIKVLEFNARLGDPETQVIMRRMQGDLCRLLYGLSSTSPEESVDVPLSWDSRTAVCVVLAAEGYPGTAAKGDPISGISQAEELKDCVVFQAGTGLVGEKITTAGGRVLNVTALADDLESARTLAYDGVNAIQFRGKQFRSDIGA